MSFDLGIWYSDVPISLEQARSFYQHINHDWGSVRRTDEIDAFLHDLLTRFPDGLYPEPPFEDPEEPFAALLDTLTDLRARAAAVPIDCKPEPFEFDEESPWAAGPISAHGATVTLSIIWSKVESTAPALHVTILYDGETIEAKDLPDRREAHNAARELARARGLDHYQVEDPNSLAQSIHFEPMPGDGTWPPGVEPSLMKIREPTEDE